MRAVNMECGSPAKRRKQLCCSNLLPLLHREQFPASGALAKEDAECKAAASRRTPKRQRLHAELTAPAEVRQSDSCPSRSAWLFPHVSCPQKLQRRRMRLSAQNKRNRLPMNHLRARTRFSNRGQSSLIASNRVVLLNQNARHSITPSLHHSTTPSGVRGSRIPGISRLPPIPLNPSYSHLFPAISSCREWGGWPDFQPYSRAYVFAGCATQTIYHAAVP